MQANMQPLHGASRAACLECGLAAVLSARGIPGGEGGHHQQVVAPSSCMRMESGTCSAGRPLGKCQDALALGGFHASRGVQKVLVSKIYRHGQGVSSTSPAESAASFFLAALASSRLSGGLKKTGFPQAMAATIVRTGLMHLHQAGTVVVRLAAVMLLQLLTQVLLT